ncbi:unnamed protein product [Tilletia controversa]|nr:unnamed protein product [Tilletia controversa]
MSERSPQPDLEAAPSQPAQHDEEEQQARKQKAEPEPPACVKSLQRCAARLNEWERKQASIARQREHTVSAPDKPEPLVNRFATVPIVAIILIWVAIVYLWRIIYPALAAHSNALATRAQGIGLCVGFCILWGMTVWSWIVAVAAQPGFAKDFLPQSDPPARQPNTNTNPYPTQFEQDPILYNGPVESRAGGQVGGAEYGNLNHGSGEDTPDPPGILSSALPIASAPKDSCETPVLSTSARSGAGTDTTAVSRSAAFLGKSPDDSMFDKDVMQHGGQGQGVSSFPSPQPSRRTRSASIASSVTGLPPSPKLGTDTALPSHHAEDDDDDAGHHMTMNGGPAHARESTSAEIPRRSDESFAMPGGLPAHAQEYEWENTDPPAHHMSLQDAMSQGPPTESRHTTFPSTPSGRGASNFLPIPQRYPNVVPLLAPVEDVPSRYCHWCKIVKPPRTHHCKKCGACVLKMDHHCPWVGGCVGALNYRFFLIFVMWVCALVVFVLVSNAVLFARGVKKPGLDLPLERQWRIDGYMISLFPICAMFGIFSLTLLSVHIYLLTTNLSTIEQLAWSSRSNSEDAVMDGWMRQPLETRRRALDDFDRAGGWARVVRRRNGKAGLLPVPATSTSSSSLDDPEERKEVAKMKKKAEDMLLMRSDWASCGLFLPHKSFMRQIFLDGGPWGEDRTEGNPWWLGGSAEHGPEWEKLVRLCEEREMGVGAAVVRRTGEFARAAGNGELCSKEAGGRGVAGARSREAAAKRQVAKLERHIRGRPKVLGCRVGAALENARQVFGDRPWEWVLPIGKPAHDGLSFPLNPRFGPNGARRPRDQWPAPLQ